jgi:glycosyltransferase involved in cell wall biosynthesis
LFRAPSVRKLGIYGLSFFTLGLMLRPPGNQVVFDMRCLQEEAYRTRGVGKVASAIVTHARNYLTPRHDWHVVGLLDVGLPDLAPQHLQLIDEVCYSAGGKRTGRNTLFVSLSPMTHDPLFVARLLDDPRILSAAIVFDFIPLAEPERYLPSPPERVAYSLRLYWLSRYRQFGAISAASAGELRQRLTIAASDVAAIGAPIDSSFAASPPYPGKRDSILVIGGGDRRKNVECALRAHGSSNLFQREDIHLIVTGNYPKYWRQELADLYKSSGGRPALLRFAGHIDQAGLADLYRRAICVVCMSRAEGFSLPVVEAMVCHTPVIASDIAAHRELIRLPEYLVACDADCDVRLRMEALFQNRQESARFVSTHDAVWPQFTGEAVAGRFWSLVLQKLDWSRRPISTPYVMRGKRPRVAFFTPLPPARSGVADYTAACLREFAHLVDLTVFTNTPSPAADGIASVWPISAFPHISRDFDRVVSVLGNSHFHLDIFRNVMRFGGACIQHDNRMLGFYSILLGRHRAERTAERELGRPLRAGELDRWLGDEATLEATFLGDVAAIADPLLLHSSRTAQIVRERFAVEPHVLPFAIYRQWTDANFEPDRQRQARDRLGIGPSEVAIISLGFVQNSKAPRECIAALEMLRSWGVPAKLYFVGEVGRDLKDLQKFCREAGVRDCVSFIAEYTSEATYRDYLLAADLAVQLRTHLLGGLSGALLDCIAVGLPAVANADLADSMDAPGYVSRVHDRPSPVLIANAMADMIERQRGLPRPHEERSAFASTHNFSTYAHRLSGALALDIARRAAA